MLVSVILPAYNEEKRLPETLREVHSYLCRQNYDYEILVVDDGSTDKTAERVGNLMTEVEHVRVITLHGNRGKGYAVRQGMLAARGTYRLFMDADNATSVEHISRILPELEQGFDVVIGSRDIEGSVIAQRQPLLRHHLGNVFNLIVQVFLGLWGIPDTQCGFKGYSAESAKQIFTRTKMNRWTFDAESLVIAKQLGYKIKEIPVTWSDDAQSKVLFSEGLQVICELVRIRCNVIYGRYK
jgi:dolichyl-phosphate beta-glucosyltransferase